MVIIMLKTIITTNKNIRKIFGKKELEIILKQVDGMNLTQSEKNRLSRDIRPKLQAVKTLSEYKNDFHLKKSSNTNKIIKKITHVILNDPLKHRIKAILLFGSQVKGTVTTRSDIDIGVLFDSIDLTEATKFRIRISGNFSENVDIQVINILPQKIKQSIARKHRVLYKGHNFNNLDFSIRYLKDNDYFIRKERIIGETT